MMDSESESDIRPEMEKKRADADMGKLITCLSDLAQHFGASFDIEASILEIAHLSGYLSEGERGENSGVSILKLIREYYMSRKVFCNPN